ncbi:minor tail protein [Gordonia phage LittleFella]|nr:minor tail protein [Gordonia phage LittleFella]
MDLTEGQYQIGDVKFGRGTKIRVVSVEPVGYEVAVGDRPLPMSDEIRFTKDYKQPGEMQFQLAVLDNYLLESMLDTPINPEDYGIVPASKLLEELKYEWSGDNVRLSWGAVKPLTYRAAGYSRMLYGRPRNFAAGPLKERPGWYGVTASYKLASSHSFEEEYSQELISPTATGTWGGSLSRAGGALAPAWPKITIVGPISNPVVKIGPHTVNVTHTVSAGQGIELNSEPWQRRAITSTGLNIGAKLPSSTYLEDLRIPPEVTWNIALHGGSTTAATKMLVQWQEAYHAI